MTPLKPAGFPPAPFSDIVREADRHSGLFQPRRRSHGWKSLDLILDSGWTDIAARCPAFFGWVTAHVPWMPNRAYIAVLDPGGEIGWHADLPGPEEFSAGFVLGLHCPEGSFIEFQDAGRYTYEDGIAYHVRLGHPHRVVNATPHRRFTAFVGSPK